MVYEKILIALEGQETDSAVLAHARRLVAQMGADATLLRVITIADDGVGGLGRQLQLEVGSSGWRRKNQAEAYLSQLECQLRRAGLSVETVLVVGTRSQGDEIVSYAAENDHDLIVLASDSRPWYRRLLGGSPAGVVQRKATVPTLFVSDGNGNASAKRMTPEANPVMSAFGSADL